MYGKKKLAGTFTPGGGVVFVGRRPPPPAPAPCLKSSMCEFGRIDTVLLGVSHTRPPKGAILIEANPINRTEVNSSNQNLRKQTPSTDQKATVKPCKGVLGLAPAKTKWVLGLALAILRKCLSWVLGLALAILRCWVLGLALAILRKCLSWVLGLALAILQ